MILNEVSSLETLCLTSLETLVFNVSLQTSKLIIKLLPDISERDDDLPGQKKEVLDLSNILSCLISLLATARDGETRGRLHV